MVERVLVEVRGIVQGVGFRPYVHGLATALDLRGLVQNRGSHVLVDVEGETGALDVFLTRLSSSPPELASIERIDSRRAALAHHAGFAIVPSNAECDGDARISPDIATCAACLAELFDPANRRFRYAFISCSDCGPRFTIVNGVPYDRSRTTMSRFTMCDDCRREYENPRDRRFHAQPIACPRCGPALAARDAPPGGERPGDALAAAATALIEGRILAVKGLGGYHLACDATNEAAVARLRQRKRREAKPLAVMLPESGIGGLLANACLKALLRSRQRPIVLVDAETWRASTIAIAANVAPGCPSIGVMLPYTPLHHLLLHDVGRPLVMTSGNTSDEPISFEDEEALCRLGHIADLFLIHDRPIRARCDDSVVRIVSERPAIVRRARGYAPEPIALAEDLPAPVLAVGGHLKNTFCLAAGRRAYVSQHIGDLETPEAYRSLGESVAHYTRLLGIDPAVVVHDLHPDYLSTRFALAFPATRLAVQHHHAHVLACCAEHGMTEPVLGVAFDGAGMGTDGAVWGAEFLLVEDDAFTRLAHLAYVPLPGGDAAAREPWRMAIAHLTAACGDRLDTLSTPLIARVRPDTLRVVRQMVARGTAAPPTSSMGRLFDAVAAIVGLRDRNAFEGQAAMELEAAATTSSRTYRFDVTTSSEPWTIHAAPVIRGVVEDVAAGRCRDEIAASFHDAVATMIADVGARLARYADVRMVALTGGVFQNVRITECAAEALERAGLHVLLHRRVPCNDGGLSLGQATFAARVGNAAGALTARRARHNGGRAVGGLSRD